MFIDEKWERLYQMFGVQDVMHFISSSDLQNAVLPAKIVFILFTLFFFGAVMYFYFNSSYLRFQFLQDVAEFFSWKAYGLREVSKRWNKITKRVGSGSESDYKLAIVEADYFLMKTLEDRDYEGETFEELMNGVSKKMLPNFDDILAAHAVRDSIVHEPDFKLDIEDGKKILATYESAINILSVS